MVFRFSLYDFLKNLRFFEAFLILALRELGMDSLDIGGLIAVREIASNLSQIPSGALVGLPLLLGALRRPRPEVKVTDEISQINRLDFILLDVGTHDQVDGTQHRMNESSLAPAPAPVERPPIAKRLVMCVARVLAVLAVVLLAASCHVLQPTGSSQPAKRHADPARLRDQVRAFTEDFGPRYHDRPENLARCREYLRRTFEKCGARVEEQAYQAGGREFRNVRAFFGDPSLPRIVVGAHYDTCEESPPEINPGADDNASGVVGLLGLAELLKHERPERVAVELVAYCTEEPPYFASNDMGSYRHAEALRKEGAVIQGALVLEMIGYWHAWCRGTGQRSAMEREGSADSSLRRRE